MRQVGLLGACCVELLCCLSPASAAPRKPRDLRGLPVAFVSVDEPSVKREIKAIYSLEPADNYVRSAWIFDNDIVYFACAAANLRIVGFNTTYAALNGSTSTRSSDYSLQTDNGDTFKFIRTSLFDDWRLNGLVKQDVDELAISDWRRALNARLEADCPR